MVGEKALRATFEDVIVNQEKMRRKLEGMIDDNRPIRSESDRAEFLKLLYRSCLGLEAKTIFSFQGAKAVYFRCPFDKVISELMYHNDSDKFKLTQNEVEETVEMRTIWKAVLVHLYYIWGLARDRASSMSVERIPYIREPAEHV